MPAEYHAHQATDAEQADLLADILAMIHRNMGGFGTVRSHVEDCTFNQCGAEIVICECIQKLLSGYPKLEELGQSTLQDVRILRILGSEETVVFQHSVIQQGVESIFFVGKIAIEGLAGDLHVFAQIADGDLIKGFERHQIQKAMFHLPLPCSGTLCFAQFIRIAHPFPDRCFYYSRKPGKSNCFCE